eukprot:GGOE01019006.1.p1 GENE.GGOE01019006.1~~GGOE01019006.1.p1  ORF type:complete len:1004 (-),score=294.17 GGOE01019006.1:201-3035(-)
MGDATSTDLSGNGHFLTFGPDVMYVMDKHFEYPSLNFSDIDDGQGAWVEINNWAQNLTNQSTQTIMGYALFAGCGGSCGIPLFTLSTNATNTVDMVAYTSITVGNVVQTNQVVLIQRVQNSLGGFSECRYGSVNTDFQGWHHVAVTRSPSEVLMYIDAKLMAVRPDDGNNCSALDMAIDRAEIGSYHHQTGQQLKTGALAGLKNPMNTKVYDWRYYDEVLDAAAIGAALTKTPTVTFTSTASESATRTSSATATSTGSATISGTSTTTQSRSRTATPTATATYSSSKTLTMIPTHTPTPTATSTSTISASSTTSRSASETRTRTITSTSTTTHTSTATANLTYTGSRTWTITSSTTDTDSRSATATPSDTTTMTVIPTRTPTETSTATSTPTRTFTPTASPTHTASSSSTPSATSTPTATASPTRTSTPTASLTLTSTSSPSLTSTYTGTATRTGGCIPHSPSCYLCDNGVPCNDTNPLTVNDRCIHSRCLGSVVSDILESPAGFRYFKVDLAVTSNLETVFSPIVWVVYSGTSGQNPWPLGGNATEGFRQLVEEGKPETLLTELAVKKSAKLIKSFGVSYAMQRVTSPTTFGQEFSFKVTGSQHDFLTFATMLVRSNDRFLAPKPPGIPFFIGLTPNYGDATDFALYDAGTEVSQGYFANLYLGQQSSQPGGGISPGPRAHGVITQVADAEFQGTGNGTFPRMSDLVSLALSPAMDVALSDSSRAQEGIDVMVEFTLEQKENIGNEIHVTFPEGFSFNSGGRTVVNVTWWGLQRYLSSGGPHSFDDALYGQPVETLVDEQARTVQARWREGTQIIPQETTTIVVVVRNVRPPNDCKLRKFDLNTFQCATVDVHNAGTLFLYRCGTPIYSASSYGDSQAVPQNCNICNACVFLYDNPETLLSMFQCQENGMTFYRSRPSALPVFPANFNAGMFSGQCLLAASSP